MSNFTCKNIPSRPCSLFFRTGTRQQRANTVVPVFLPFSGCPSQCVYCAQDRQTGGSRSKGIQSILEDLRSRLALLLPCQNGESRELAFYGGTFTALPEEERRACLAFLKEMMAAGIITHARCSTRPDALPPSVLDELKAGGISLIELGIQSFSSEALARTRRGYDGPTAVQACRTVQEAGFELGIQLLPGMPGCTPDIFLEDTELTLSLRPACLRFYPCLVPEGTALARWFREDRYSPWTLEETVNTLGRALGRAWEEEIPVIRLSVAPEPAFDTAILAGPRHPALGALIQAEALLQTVRKAIETLGEIPEGLYLPKACQGFMYGDKGLLKPRWAALGLPPERLHFTDAPYAELRGCEEK